MNNLQSRTANNAVEYSTLMRLASTQAGGGVVQSRASTTISSINNTPLILSNDDSSATIEIVDNGEVKFNSGVTYKVVNDTSTVGSYILTNNDFFISINNELTTSVILPLAASNPGQYYIISRNYPQITTGPRAETIPIYTALQLRVTEGSGDSVDIPGQIYTNIGPFTRQKIISDGVNRWHLV